LSINDDQKVTEVIEENAAGGHTMKKASNVAERVSLYTGLQNGCATVDSAAPFPDLSICSSTS
jgi:hypothetical protein